MKWFVLACFMILGFIAAPLSADQSRLEKVIPVEMEKQGWKAEDEPIIAFDENTLSMVINGAAPRYMELGTRKAAFVYYEKESVYLMPEIFQADSGKNAERLYGEFASGKSTPIDNLGTRARITSELGGTLMVE